MALNSQDTDLKFKFDFTSPTSFPTLEDSHREQQTTELKSLLNSLEDPLDAQVLEKLSLFFEVNGGNPESLMELYRDCIETSIGSWRPFMGTLSSTLSEGVVACKYLMVGYTKAMHLAFIRNLQDRAVGDRRQKRYIKNEFEKGFTELSDLIKLNSPMLSAAASNESVNHLTRHITLENLYQFIWEDGKCYKSKIGRLTANRDGSISINLSSAEFKDFNILRNIKFEPKHWEFILNRDLNQLVSYISSNPEDFKGLDNSVTRDSKIVKFLNNLTSQVPGNANQWTHASDTIEGPRYTLPCKFYLEFTFKVEGPLPTNNMMELIETICVMLLLDWERVLKLSQAAKSFLWYFISKLIFDHLKFNHQKLVVDKADQKAVILKGLSEGLCQEDVVSYRSLCGDRTWELTDGCDKYVTVEFTYVNKYQTFEISKKKEYRSEGYRMMRAPPADARARLFELETRLRNVETTDQSDFLKPLLYLKRDDSIKAQVPLAS